MLCPVAIGGFLHSAGRREMLEFERHITILTSQSLAPVSESPPTEPAAGAIQGMFSSSDRAFMRRSGEVLEVSEGPER